jgi:hypothetical protein
MNKLAKSALVIVVAALMVYVAMGMFSFFDVGIDVYGNYVLWGLALVLFSVILPEKVDNIFSKEHFK